MYKALVISLLLSLMSALAVTAVAAELVLYFNFNEGTGDTASDSSGKGNNGVLVGNVRWVDGKYGKAIQVDNSYVEVEQSDSLNITEAVTIAAWIYPTSDVQSAYAKIIEKDFSRPNPPYISYGISVNFANTGKYAFEVAAEGTISGPQSTSLFAPNEWTHIAGVYDGSTIAIYINGVMEASQDKTGVIDESEGNLYIGKSTPGVNEPFTGIIDEVVVWDGALTESEIQELMMRITAVRPSGKLATSWGRIKSQRM